MVRNEKQLPRKISNIDAEEEENKPGKCTNKRFIMWFVNEEGAFN